MISRRGQFESLLSGLMTRSSVQQRKRRATASRRMQPVEAVEQRLMLDASYFALAGGDFSQDWSNSELITTNDDWSSVPSIVGFRGDGLTTSTGADPQTVVGESTIVDVNANQTTGTFSTGGVSEFALTNPVVGLAGSGTADAPYLQLHLDASGRQDIQVSYLLRDIDSSADNAIEPVALQYAVSANNQ